LIRQLLTENVALAACGGVLGWALAWGLIRLLPALDFAAIPRLDALRMDPSVVAITACLSLGAGLLFGTVPAIGISAIGSQTQGRGGGTGAGSRPSALLRGGLVVAQVSIALMLLNAAGLLRRVQVFRRRIG
jgi:putative ABC transport system permease protein